MLVDSMLLIFELLIAIPKLIYGTNDNLSKRQRKEIYENAPTIPKNPSARTWNRYHPWAADDFYG